MPYFRFLSLEQGYSNYIKAAQRFPEALFYEIISGRPDNPVDLSLVNCSQRVNKEGIPSGPHFRKNDCLSLAGNDVDLTKLAQKISGQYPVSSSAQVSDSYILASFADADMACFIPPEGHTIQSARRRPTGYGGGISTGRGGRGRMNDTVTRGRGDTGCLMGNSETSALYAH